jgi:hypothetical protein
MYESRNDPYVAAHMTDSVVVMGEYLDKFEKKEIYGKNIGQFKKELEFDEAVFLRAKAYGLRKGKDEIKRNT